MKLLLQILSHYMPFDDKILKLLIEDLMFNSVRSYIIV